MSGKPWSDYDKAYLAAFYESDGPELMGVLFNRNKRAIRSYVWKMRNENQWDYYKRKWYEGTANDLGRD